MGRTGTVVVGVDGSPGSRAALVYAIEEAGCRDARLRVVAAAPLPEYWAAAYGIGAYATGEPFTSSEIVAGVRKEAQLMVDEVTAQHPGLAAGSGVIVEARAGRPVDVLIEAAQGADVLVLGHRGRGALTSTLLGSVGLGCVLHAQCPVTIVPSAPEAVPEASDAVPSGAVPATA